MTPGMECCQSEETKIMKENFKWVAQKLFKSLVVGCKLERNSVASSYGTDAFKNQGIGWSGPRLPLLGAKRLTKYVISKSTFWFHFKSWTQLPACSFGAHSLFLILSLNLETHPPVSQFKGDISSITVNSMLMYLEKIGSPKMTQLASSPLPRHRSGMSEMKVACSGVAKNGARAESPLLTNRFYCLVFLKETFWTTRITTGHY